jgi:peptidoglycan biosynthesis protein MviN/MurJ (putative lipid II flippase)
MATPSTDRATPPGRPTSPAQPPRRRGFVEVRWRQFRRAPRPVFRAVMSSLSVALVLGIAFLAYDIALDRGVPIPGGDLRLLVLALYVLLVCLVGAVVTWLVVPWPAGNGTGRRTRTPWSLALGLFAAVPIAYLVLVALHEIVKPLVT